MDIAAYLNRINYHGPLESTAETLRALHFAHRTTVPFENLSIGLGEAIVLDDDWLFDKVITRRRGGFCYELNGLFAILLRTLGFDVTMLSAAVMRGSGEFGPDFDHMALMVKLAERWLVDVGFGDSFLKPLLMDVAAPQTQGDRAHRIEATGDCLIMLESSDATEWKTRYRFTLEPRRKADFAEMCRHHQLSPDSPFTQGRICVVAKEDGLIWISKSRLVAIISGARKERELTNDAELALHLRDHRAAERRRT